MDFKIPGLPHSTVKHMRSTGLRQLIQKIENHPHRHVFQQKLRQNPSFHFFSPESKQMIRDLETSNCVNCSRRNPKIIAKYVYHTGTQNDLTDIDMVKKSQGDKEYHTVPGCPSTWAWIVAMSGESPPSNHARIDAGVVYRTVEHRDAQLLECSGHWRGERDRAIDDGAKRDPREERPHAATNDG